MEKSKIVKIMPIWIILVFVGILLNTAWIKTSIIIKQNSKVFSNGTPTSSSYIDISKEKKWNGTDEPEMYQSEFALYKCNADRIIMYIEDLVDLANDVNSGEKAGAVVLARDLDFKDPKSYREPEKTMSDINNKSGNGFPIIGIDENHRFIGTFFGDGHVIKNIYINSNNSNYDVCVGFFGSIRGNIYNLTITGDIIATETENIGTIRTCYAK